MDRLEYVNAEEHVVRSRAARAAAAHARADLRIAVFRSRYASNSAADTPTQPDRIAYHPVAPTSEAET